MKNRESNEELHVNRLAIKYIRHLQFLLASPPGSTVDFEATNFSLEPLPSWRSMGFMPGSSRASTSNDNHTSHNYNFSSIVLKPSQQSCTEPIASSSTEICIGGIDSPYASSAHASGEPHSFTYSYESSSPLSWTTST